MRGFGWVATSWRSAAVIGLFAVASVWPVSAASAAASVRSVSAAAAAVRPVSAGATAPAGAVLGFGDNHFGELGNTTSNGTETANPTPTVVSLPGQIGAVTQVATGQNYSLVLTSSGQLYAFGGNDFGQLGIANNAGTSTPNPIPTLVTLPGQDGVITHIATGAYHSLVATSSGQLYGFGLNNYGQLGSATNNGTSNPNPTPTLVNVFGQGGGITAIAAGADHSLIVTSTGQLITFGDNQFGQLGDTVNAGQNLPNPTPTLITPLPGQTGAVSQIVAGGSHSLVLTSSGQLFGFGENNYGQLGSSTDNGTTNPHGTPTLISVFGATTITQIAAGSNHSLLVDSTGQLFSFGDNDHGELGNTSGVGQNVANPVPVADSLTGQTGPITGIVGGGSDSAVLTATGQLYTFGDNQFGELGTAANAGTDNANPAPTQVALAPGTTIDTVGEGPQSGHFLALVSDLSVSTAALPAGQVGAAYQASLTATGGTPPLTWSAAGLPAGMSLDPSTGAITGVPSAAGGSQVTATVTDRYGSRATQVYLLTITAAPPPGGTTPPKITRVSQSHQTWREGKALATITRRKAPVGTTFTFTLNANASVSLAFGQLLRGRKASRHKCVAQTRRNRHKPACTRTKAAGVLGFTGHPGVNTVHFDGRITRSKTLRTGRYMLTITATNSAGKAKPQTLTFTIAAH
jgi:alpha-tubulin suppressor-like RCC1 family protein